MASAFSEDNTNIEMDDIDPEDDSEEEITSAQVYKKLLLAWQNEKLCPDLLPHIHEMVTLMLGQIAHMEENLSTLSSNDFLYVVHQLELERIKYLLADYLRCRLKKIEKYTAYLLAEDAQRSGNHKRLSPEETKFANEYRDLMESHFHQVAVRHMPANLQQNDEQQRMVKPNLKECVLVRVTSGETHNIVGDDNEEYELTPNAVHVVPYYLVSDLLLKGAICLN